MAVAVFSLELASGALTRWQGVAPTSLCHHDGTVVASDGQALYRLAGDSDDGAPLAVCMRLPASDGGLPGPKRLRTVRLEGMVPNRVTVSAQSDTGLCLEGTAGSTGQGRCGLDAGGLSARQAWGFFTATGDQQGN